MSFKHPDEEVLALDDVFQSEDEVVGLALSAEEWEVIIALAEAGGSAAVRDLGHAAKLSREAFANVLRSLLDRGILARGVGVAPTTAAAAPDAEVAQYLEYLADLNYYQVLQLNPEADAASVRRSYFRLMREYHPDRFMKEPNEDTREKLKEIFRVLTRAYETLSDPALRREYDLTIPEFTGAQEKEDEQAFAALWTGPAGPEALPEANPDMARSFYQSALEDFKRGNHAEAELNFKLAVALDPSHDDYQAGLAKTRRILRKRMAKDDAVKALYFEEEGKHRFAIRWMSRAVDSDPENVDYRYDLARLLEAHGSDLHAARTQLQLAFDLDLANLDSLLLLAKIQERMNEFPDARRTLKKILSLDKNNIAAKKAMERMKK
jgi:curved DNA-binding protein CbpA